MGGFKVGLNFGGLEGLLAKRKVPILAIPKELLFPTLRWETSLNFLNSSLGPDFRIKGHHLVGGRNLGKRKEGFGKEGLGLFNLFWVGKPLTRGNPI